MCTVSSMFMIPHPGHGRASGPLTADKGDGQPAERGKGGALECTKKAMLRRAANVPGHLRSTAGYLRSRASHPRCLGFIEKNAICPFFSSFIHENPSYVYMRQWASVSNRTLLRFGTLWLQLSGYLAAPAQDMYFYRARRYLGFHVTIRLCAHCNFSFLVNWIL